MDIYEVKNVFTIDINNINYLYDLGQCYKLSCDSLIIETNNFKCNNRQNIINKLFKKSQNKIKDTEKHFFFDYEKNRTVTNRFMFLKKNKLIPTYYNKNDIYIIKDTWKEYYIPNLKIWSNYNFPPVYALNAINIFKRLLDITDFNYNILSGIFYYPPNNGYREWHTNFMDDPGYRLYIVYKNGNKKSGTNLLINNNIKTIYDLDNITINIFKINNKKPYLWHSIFSNNKRFSVGFKITDKQANYLWKKYYLFLHI